MKPFIYLQLVRLITLLYSIILQLFCIIIPKAKVDPEKTVTILITGTFYSDQWLTTHLIPLALSERVSSVVMVASRPVPIMTGVEAIYTSPLMMKIFGEVGARSLLFMWHGMHRRYDVLAGFHLLFNGMFAVLIARMTRKRSLYICGGGPREIQGGGYDTENKIYGRLSKPDRFTERLLISIVKKIDISICMGTSAVDYLRQNQVNTQIEIVPGGFSPKEFFPHDAETEYDFVLVGRLSQVKRVDLFLEVIAEVKLTHPAVKAVIVGDGPDKQKLEKQADDAGISENVHFAGWQDNVADWLRCSKVFVLTSESEGLSQALLQALMCGLPAIVSNVGDLKDTVTHAYNGFLIEDLQQAQFVRAFKQLLEDEKLFSQLRENAIISTQQYQVANVAKAWGNIL